jgi:hypothetical protein
MADAAMTVAQASFFLFSARRHLINMDNTSSIVDSIDSLTENRLFKNELIAEAISLEFIESTNSDSIPRLLKKCIDGAGPYPEPVKFELVSFTDPRKADEIVTKIFKDNSHAATAVIVDFIQELNDWLDTIQPIVVNSLKTLRVAASLTAQGSVPVVWQLLINSSLNNANDQTLKVKVRNWVYYRCSRS